MKQKRSMKAYADLHTHSTASDGSIEPGRLAALAREAGLAAIALTDHDTVAGLSAFLKGTNDCGITGVAGIEISSRWDFPNEVHILGYFVDHTDQEFCRRLKLLQDARNERNRKMIKLLHEQGVDVGMQEWENEAPGHIIGRLHLAKVLVRKGICSDVREAFKRFIGRDGSAYLPKERLTSVEAVRFLRESGAAPVLAHPGLLNLNSEELRSFLIVLKENGLIGVECFHSDHDSRVSRRFQELAVRLQLVVTGGSDFHGSQKRNVTLGSPCVPLDYLVRLKDAMNLMRSDGF